MKYEFPEIRHIDDVLPAIEGCGDFIVAVKDGYTVINYVLASPETFPPVHSAGGTAKQREQRIRHAAIRRECRGMIFCNWTGKILRRPYHKFFNVGEKEETFPKNIDLASEHHVLMKLDGSMIVPFYLEGRLRFGTKMGCTDVAAPVEEFVKANPQYLDFCEDMIGAGWSPIFEWCSRKQRIVLDYGQEDQLILTAARRIVEGTYMDYDQLKANAAVDGIPVVDVHDPITDMVEFLKYADELKGIEGFVVRFLGGHMAKIKTSEYIQIHKAKEAILQDRGVVELILMGSIDDVKAHLPAEDVVRLEEFENEFAHRVDWIVGNISGTLSALQKAGTDRKNFSLNMSMNYDPLTKAAIFKLFDSTDASEVRAHVLKTIKDRLTKNASYQDLKDYWLRGIDYN